MARFEAYEVAMEAAQVVMPMMARVPGRYGSLADQAMRAVAGVPLSLAEGAGRTGKDRLYHWRIAYGSALETTAALKLLDSVGGVPTQPARRALELLDRVQAMAWRMTR